MSNPPLYPTRLARLEWHLAANRYAARLIDAVFHWPRRAWRSWRWRRTRHPAALYHAERQVSSQHGEDGILAEIFRRVGEGGRYVIEFGVEDGSECLARNLVEQSGWRGVLMEGGLERATAARYNYLKWPVQVAHEFVTLDNVLGLFQKYAVPAEPDLFALDIDGNDYWVLSAVLTSYRPRVLAGEYNARWVPPLEWVMPYDPGHAWEANPTCYFGASLASLSKLCQAHGYQLVGCDSTGTNAFFVRRDQLGDHFPDHDLGVRYHYAPPSYYPRGYGHPIRIRAAIHPPGPAAYSADDGPPGTPA
jgi:hypothetical protein